MQLQLKRIFLNEHRTIGELHLNGKFFCHTLEDTVRDIEAGRCGNKVKAKTAIPAGTYEVVLTFSNRFQKYLPLLLSVPCFEGIRIHGGNTEANSEGCILVGAKTDGTTKIWECAGVLAKLISEIKKVEKKEKVFIVVG